MATDKQFQQNCQWLQARQRTAVSRDCLSCKACVGPEAASTGQGQTWERAKSAVQNKPVSVETPNGHRDALPRQAERDSPGQRTAHLLNVSPTASATVLKQSANKLLAAATPIASAGEVAGEARQQEPAESGAGKQATPDVSSSPSIAQGAAGGGGACTAPHAAPKAKRRFARGLLRPSAASADTGGRQAESTAPSPARSVKAGTGKATNVAATDSAAKTDAAQEILGQPSQHHAQDARSCAEGGAQAVKSVNRTTQCLLPEAAEDRLLVSSTPLCPPARAGSGGNTCHLGAAGHARPAAANCAKCCWPHPGLTATVQGLPHLPGSADRAHGCRVQAVWCRAAAGRAACPQSAASFAKAQAAAKATCAECCWRHPCPSAAVQGLPHLSGSADQARGCRGKAVWCRAAAGRAACPKCAVSSAKAQAAAKDQAVRGSDRRTKQ